MFHPSQQATYEAGGTRRLSLTVQMGNRSIRLTGRERQLVNLLAEGHTNKEMAKQLGVSDQTIKNQLTTLYRKTNVSSRLELVVVALRKGFAGVDFRTSTKKESGT